MADQVTGAFLSCLGQYIFETLTSSNLRDYFRRGKLDKLVEELESTLDSINQVLDDAEIKQYQIPKVKKWLGDVKHAMYEADQLLDEIVTDAPLKKLKAESQPSTSYNIVNFIPTFTNPFESRIKELIKSLHSLVEQQDKLQLKNQTYGGNAVGFNSKPSERLQTTYLVDASGIYGRDSDKDEMIKILLSENGSSNQTPIISIVGLGGMGKTTLAKLLYNDIKIGKHFELKAWVYVSESFDVVGLTKAILKSFNSSTDGEDLNLLQHELQRLLSGKKYLLVLDDIWNGNAECWEQLLLPLNHGSSGSKIIVTTREKEVADVLNSTLFDLEQLDKSDCWSLFVTHAFRGKNVCEYPNLESIGQEIVNKCGGLPLAVKTLGQLLRRKFSEHEWRKILETDMWRLSDEDNNINPVLRLSYHNLPSNRKCCFAYCSIFPKGYDFDKGGLIKFWMADGLLKCSGADKSEEELGNEIFGDLESISFFQKSFYYAEYHTFVMHDLVNDLAKSVSGEFCMQIEGSRVEGIPERTRHIWLSLELNSGDILLEPVFERKELRSLMLEYCSTTLLSNNVQRDLFSRLTCLRMLSFRYSDLSKLVDEIGNLKLLRYLDLSCTKIRSLPDTICMLYNLQTLLLERCFKLTELPSNFSKLVNLRHLELPFDGPGHPCITKIPKNIGKLNKLQSLSYFIVEEQNGSVLKELEKLNHLHGGISIQGLGNVIDPADAAMANLKDKKFLEELNLAFQREEMNDSIVERNASVLEALQPNSYLKRLTIVNYNGNSFPNWLRGCHLPNLVFLKLQTCSHLPQLGQLPCLKELFISHCDGIKIICKEFYNDSNSTSLSLRSLEVLIFYGMKNWEEWLCHEGFRMLKTLSIRQCPELKRVPSQHLPSLQKLEISDCNKLEECLCLEGSPLLEKVSIKYCSKLKRAPLPQHLPSLQKLNICDCEMLEASIPKGDSMIELHVQRCDRILVNELSTSLKKFVLWENRYTEFSKEKNLVNCTILEELQFDLGGFVVKYSSLDLNCNNSLGELSIRGCQSFSLPFSLHLFTNLQDLKLYDCPQLESFPRGGLPSNLSRLVIENCPKLIGSREEWGLFQLNSLIYFEISDDEFENVESFPEENLLPPTLGWLILDKCSKLRIMNYKGFLHLNSLHTLWIVNCPSLESLPEEGLQQLSTLDLSIEECPLISDKYKKEGGERWHTIRHISKVKIDGIDQHE